MKHNINVSNQKKPETQNFRVSKELGLRVKKLGIGISGTTRLFEAILDTLDKHEDIKKEILEYQLKHE